MTPEGAVLKSVCDLLAAERIPFWRMNTGAIKVDKRFFRFGQKGMADVLAAPILILPMFKKALKSGNEVISDFKAPNFLWIECKSAKGRQTDDQQDFESYVTANGMSYIVARSSDDVLAWLKDNGVTR